MNLYISRSDYASPVSHVHLIDGHIPAIGGVPPEPDEEGEDFPSMEPAGWFKVLIIDSACVDLERRCIHWKSKTNTEDLLAGDSTSSTSRERQKRISESMYIGGDSYGNQDDGFCDLMAGARKLINQWPNPNVKPATILKNLFTMLHCYILPNIKLTSDDVAMLEKALAQQEKLIEDCNKEIVAKFPRLEQMGNSMKKQRLVTYVPELNTPPKKPLSYPQELIRCLEAGICMDLKDIWGKVESENEGIQSLKADSDQDSSSSGGGKPDNELELAVKRKTRDDLMKTYENFIHARESLHTLANGCAVGNNPPPGVFRNQRRRKRFSRKKPEEIIPLHKIYIEMFQEFNMLEKHIQMLAMKKVRLTSIKEAIKSTIKELEENEATSGVEIDRTGSQRPTDVLRHSRVPKRWQTMTEKVASAINKGGTVTNLFQEFVAHFQVQCQGLLTEHENAQKAVPLNFADKETGGLNPTFYNPGKASGGVPIVEPHRGALCLPRSQPKPSDMYRDSQPNLDSLAASDTHSKRKSDDYLFVFDQEYNYLKKGIVTLEKGIKQHFEEMVSIFLNKLKLEKSAENKRRIWLCYESHFYEAVMPILVKVYNTAYSSEMQRLQDYVPALTLQDLSFKNVMFLNLLEPTEVRDAPQQDATSGSSVESSQEEAKKEESMELHGLEGAVGGIDIVAASSSYDNQPAQMDEGLMLEMVRLGINTATPEKRSHRECSVYDDRLQERDVDDVFLNIVPALEKSDQTEYFTCEDDLAAKDSGLSCEEVQSSKPDVSEDDYRLSLDSNPPPRLQMLASTIELSDSSSLSSDSSDNQRTSDLNDQLLQEAEDIVAGVKTMRLREAKERLSQRSVSVEAAIIPEPFSAPSVDPRVDRDIKVHDPDSVTVVFRPGALPRTLQSPTNHDRDIESGQEAVELDRAPQKQSSVSSISQLRLYKSTKFHSVAAAKFQPEFELLSRVITTTAPLVKLEGLKDSQQLLSQVYNSVLQELGEESIGANADELIDLNLLMLANYDPVLASSLYPQILLLESLLAPGLENGIYSYSLMQFQTAFEYLLIKIKEKQDLAENARAQQALGETV